MFVRILGISLTLCVSVTLKWVYSGEKATSKIPIISEPDLSENESLFEDALDIATRIIAKFETGADSLEDAYSVTAGCYDYGYLSFGIFQYNLGKGTLQPIIREFNAVYPEELKTYFGNVDDAGVKSPDYIVSF